VVSVHIIGTAGHVDHGKSTLVRALTGTDPDRLPEEKLRALTIELGFASYRNDAGQTIGVIDVPGHERFIRNMVAGTWSLDCAMLVIAADDGWMEQTEDHAQVLCGMRVPSVFVVLTKRDLADEKRLSEVTIDIEKRFTALFGYEPEIVVASALHDPDLRELKRCIDRHLMHESLHCRVPALFVDRTFIMAGTGPVITGSLRGGFLTVGSEVTILPKMKRSRIRSLQCFGKAVERVEDGTRTALGLQGIGIEELSRGDCLTTRADLFSVTQQAYVLLVAPYADGKLALKNHVQVEIASGTWHDTCSVHFLGRPVQGMHHMLVRIVSHETQAWYWQQPVILMQPGASTVIAYGTVIVADNLAKTELNRLRELLSSDNVLPADIDSPELLRLFLSGYRMLPGRMGNELSVCDRRFLRIGQWWIAAEITEEIKQRLFQAISRQQQPLALEEAKQSTPYPASVVAAVIRRLEENNELRVRNGKLEKGGTQEEPLPSGARELLIRIERNGFDGYESRKLTREEKPLVGILLHADKIVILESTFIYSVKTLGTMIGLVLQGRKVKDRFTIGEAKTHIPLSRKYMLPLLNHMEQAGYVRRIGDIREVIRLPE